MASHSNETSTTVLAAPRHWIAAAVILFILTEGLGLVTKYVHGLLTPQLGIDRAINSVANPAFTAVAKVFDKLDSPPVVAVILLIGGVIIFFAISRGSIGARLLRVLAFWLIAGVGWVTCIAVKDTVRLDRPVNVGLPHPIAVTPETLSYTSGHVAFIAALLVAIVAQVASSGARALWIVLLSIVMVLVGLSRLYLGVHYPTDVVGGILNGLAGGILVLGIWNAIARRASASRGGERAAARRAA